MSYVEEGLKKLNGAIADSRTKVSSVLAQLNAGNGANLTHNGSYRLTGAQLSVGGATVRDALSSHTRALSAEADYVSALRNKVIRVEQYFRDTENGVCRLLEDCQRRVETPPDIQAAASAPSAPADAESGSFWGSIPWDKLAKKVIGSLGMVGSMFSSVDKMFGGTWVDFLTGGIKTVSNTVKWIDIFGDYKKLTNFGHGYAEKLYAKKLFGLDKYLKTPSKSANTWTAFKRNFSTSFKKGVSNPVSWVTNGIASGYKNFLEYQTGAITGDRAVVEWATETATDVVIGAGVTALTGAALAAVGVTSAPVLVVGAISGVALMGVDALWSNTIGYWVTGSEAGIAETVGHVVGDVYDGLKSTANKVKNAVSDFIGSIFS